MWRWIQKSKNIKNDLLNFKDEPLTGISVFLLIMLNIFIFTNINIGVQAEMNKTPKVNYYYPYKCSEYFNNIKETYESFSYYDNYKWNNYKNSSNTISKYCQEVEKKIDVFKLQKYFSLNLNLIKTIKSKQEQNKQRLSEISKKYNTRLFETIANMSNNKELRSVKNEYDALMLDNINLEKELNSIPPLNSLIGYNDYVKYVQNNKESFMKSKESYMFWQPFKAYMHMLIFIIPLLSFFGYFYYRTKKKQLKDEPYNPIVKIISANISLLLSLPLLWYTLSLIYHVLPKTFLKNIIEFLVDIGLISMLNYFAIFLVVLFFGGLIYYIQKRTIKLKQSTPNNTKFHKLISWSKCFNCELNIDYKNQFCPFCGITLNKNCPSCNNKIIIHDKYCSSCGKINNPIE